MEENRDIIENIFSKRRVFEKEILEVHDDNDRSEIMHILSASIVILAFWEISSADEKLKTVVQKKKMTLFIMNNRALFLLGKSAVLNLIFINLKGIS